MRARDLGEISTGCCRRGGTPTFTKDDRISRCPSLITGERTEAKMWEMPHDKQPVHGINTRRHKPRMFVDVFKIVLFSSVPRQRLSLQFSIYNDFLRVDSTLTVPYSRYTAEPVAATIAPTNHIVNAIPTLPADLKITLGVAKILPICGLTPSQVV